MEDYISKLQNRLCTEPECRTESFISYLFVEGYMTLEEYKKFLNSNNYIPTLQFIEDHPDDFIHGRCNREEIVDNRDSLKEFTLDTFEL